MSTEAKTRTKLPRLSPAELPQGCLVLLSKEQIRAAIGVGDRVFDGMVSAGEYPRADLRIGRFPRWTIATHNRWVAERLEAKD